MLTFSRNKVSGDVVEDHRDARGSAAAHTHSPLICRSPSRSTDFSSRCSASMPQSLTANKIITDTLLMSQNYIKSLKVDECTWQTIHFGGPVGTEPGDLALTHLCKPNHLRCSKEARLAAAASHVLCVHATNILVHVSRSLNVFKPCDA